MTVIFGLEAVVKIVAFGGVGYFCDRFNTFDLFVVLLSLPEIILPDGAIDFTFLRMLRMLRLFRSFKVLYNTKYVRDLSKGVLGASSQMVSFGLLLFLLIFICTLAGMQVACTSALKHLAR